RPLRLRAGAPGTGTTRPAARADVADVRTRAKRPRRQLRFDRRGEAIAVRPEEHRILRVGRVRRMEEQPLAERGHPHAGPHHFALDRKSTRLNSSHVKTSYAVFCLKKKTRADVPHAES